MPTLVLSGTSYPLETELILGRHRSCGIQIKDDAASRQHAKIFLADGLWWVEDLGSANGTSLNGSKIQGRKRLRDQDIVAIGSAEISFQEDAGNATGAVPAGRREVSTAGNNLSGFAGQTIAGYRIERLLGRGMLGVVYRGHQLNLDRPVAFKIFDPERCNRDAGLAARFLSEAGKVGSVTHDGLVQLHESGNHHGLLWCSMEWVDGDTLETKLKQEQRLDPELALLIVEKVAEALDSAHAQGVIHGDLRPSHVIVMSDGRIRLTDVGMMGIFEEGELPANGPAAVAWYLSPEEATDGASDPRSDVYSLGCMLFHLLAGRPPFDGTDTAAVIAAHAREPIPSIAGAGIKLDVAATDALIHGMLAKNPEWRHTDMGEIIGEIRALRERLGGRASEQAPRPIMRRASEIRAQPAARGAAREPDHHLRRFVMPVLVCILLALAVVVGLPYLQRSKTSMSQSVAEPATTVSAPPASPVTPAPAPAPAPVASASPVTATAPSALVEHWRELEVQLNQVPASLSWSTAEVTLTAFAQQAKAEPALVRRVNERLQQLQTDGDQWYLSALAALPQGATPLDIAERLRRIDLLRDQVLADNRPDAESRYQEALTRLGQRLNAAKRQARQALETGAVLELPRIANELAPAFAKTPVSDLHRQFSLLCNEATGIKPQWATSWAVTKPRLLASKGANALAAAAALLLIGDTAEAKALLANDPTLATGELLRRREAIFGRKAAVLAFDEPDDLQFIEIITGEPRMAGGALTAAPGEAIGIACAVPINASGWDVTVGANLEQAQADGQAVISLAKGDSADAQVRVERNVLVARVRTAIGWQEARAPRPAGKLLRLRMAERGGSVLIYANDQQLLVAAQARVANGSVLRFEAVGLLWSLADLQLVGGDG